jgi:hypothetical protein
MPSTPTAAGEVAGWGGLENLEILEEDLQQAGNMLSQAGEWDRRRFTRLGPCVRVHVAIVAGG